MPRTVENILEHAEELAKRFEDYEPAAGDARDPKAFVELREAVESRARAERSIVAAVERSRASGYSWRAIGALLGTSGEAARQRYGRRRAA